VRIGSVGLLGRYVQRPTADRRRVVDYSRFLSKGEVVKSVSVSVTPTTDPEFEIHTLVISPEGDKVAYYARGGVEGEEYTATFTVTTSLRQVWPHDIRFAVREPPQYG